MIGFLFINNKEYITDESNKYSNSVVINHNAISIRVAHSRGVLDSRPEALSINTC